MTAVGDIDLAKAFLRALGDELRQARRLRGWTRKDLQRRLATDISLQTLATYELGTRQCGVLRFVELTDALEVSALDLLSRAQQRVARDHDTSTALSVDLVAAAHTERAGLGPLRRWARSRLRDVPEGQRPVLRLDPAALEHLAEVCGLDLLDLVRRLRDLAREVDGT